MKLKDIYDFCVWEGLRTDLRSKQQIREALSLKKKEFKALSVGLKKFFDNESLKHPFSDTRILNGDPKMNVSRVMVGIDIEVGEILLADRLGQLGRPVDLVLAHHPEGIALAGLDEVMTLQADELINLGVDPKVAKDFMDKRIHEVSRKLHSANHTRTVDAAKLLGIALMSCHTPSDNHVVDYLDKYLQRKKPKTISNLVDLLLTLPEYQDAACQKAGPKIWIGKPKDQLGRVWVDMTGGTEGSKDLYGRLSQLGIKTLLCMHLSEQHFEKIKSEHINVIVAGHMASDNLGMNLLLDKLEKKEDFDIVECSGFKRIRRI